MDSDGDGIGDLQGILSKLDYIKSVGADTIWISPIYESPQVDLGYDISDYEVIHKPYGSVQDVELLIQTCHAKNLRIVLDLVINHTSSFHPWFIESRSSRSNPKADWYIWRDPHRDAEGTLKPPNNWRSNFGGSAWEWNETRQQYYLHLFSKEMPDVNWNSKDLRQALYRSAMRFWLDKGIDGFRIDTMTIYAKNPDFPDAPVSDPDSPWQLGSCHYRNQLENFDYHREMHEEVWSKYGELLTVGEYGNTSDTELALKYCSAAAKCVGMGFQFETVLLGYEMCQFQVQDWDLNGLRASIAKWQNFIEGTDGWTSVFLENHDIGRSVSRFGSDDPQHREMAAKMLAVLQATCTGTLFLYQGQEIGMTNLPACWQVEEYKDLNTQRYWDRVLASGASSEQIVEAKKSIDKVARDHARSPMQWNSDAHAGFTSPNAQPWMRVNDNYVSINVDDQEKRSNSILAFWKELLLLRTEYSSLFVHGSFRLLDEGKQVMSYTKVSGESRALVLLNFTKEKQIWHSPQDLSKLRLRVTNAPQCGPDDQALLPYEARIYL